MIVKLFQQRTHTIIPQLNDASVQAKQKKIRWGAVRVSFDLMDEVMYVFVLPSQNPWSFRMKRYSFNTR